MAALKETPRHGSNKLVQFLTLQTSCANKTFQTIFLSGLGTFSLCKLSELHNPFISFLLHLRMKV